EIGPGGGALSQLASIDVSGLDSRLRNVKLEVACDVDNPLTGPKGAPAVFGPQKGATADMLDVLDQNVSHFADMAEKAHGSTFRDT
ncbi:glycerate kinase, partial [Staphylococcus aureus]|uniref:glycerate kinase n=1 Tax=Staphylococcus aureus TaxID=1280 RepID=UPI001E61C50C